MSGKPGFYRSYTSASLIAPYTLVNFVPGEDDTVTQAVDGTKFIVGPAQIVGVDNADYIGAPVDICRGGLPEVLFGGVVNAGDPLTSDANGHAIAPAIPAPGQSVHIVGFAEQAAVAGDIGLYLHAPGIIAG